MVNPESFSQFYGAAAGAGATLIGFLAVANSIIDSKDNTRTASLQESILAESAYSAFANVFLLSLIGLEPFINIGYGAIVLSIVGLISTYRLQRSGLYRLRKLSKARAQISRTVLVGTAATYVAELIAGILTVLNQDEQTMVVVLVYVIIALTTIGLTRAWELMGLRKILGKDE